MLKAINIITLVGLLTGITSEVHARNLVSSQSTMQEISLCPANIKCCPIKTECD